LVLFFFFFFPSQILYLGGGVAAWLSGSHFCGWLSTGVF